MQREGEGAPPAPALNVSRHFKTHHPPETQASQNKDPPWGGRAGIPLRNAQLSTLRRAGGCVPTLLSTALNSPQEPKGMKRCNPCLATPPTEKPGHLYLITHSARGPAARVTHSGARAAVQNNPSCFKHPGYFWRGRPHSSVGRSIAPEPLRQPRMCLHNHTTPNRL